MTVNKESKKAESKKKVRGQNEGTIRQRKDGSWEARYTVGRDSNGKQIQKSIYGKTRPEVAKKLTKALNDINSGVYVEPSKLTVSSWLDTWLEEYKKPSVKPKTYDSYKQMIDLYIKPAIGYITLKELRPDHIQAMLNEIKDRIPMKTQVKIKELKIILSEVSKENKDKIEKEIVKLEAERISNRTVRYVNTILYGALKRAVKNALIIKNAAEAMELPENDNADRRVLTIEEQKKFIEALEGERMGAALKVLICTGLRIGELLALSWDDINLEEGLLKVNNTISRVKNLDGKGNKTKIQFGTPKTEKSKRQLPLLESIVKVLKAHKAFQNEERLRIGNKYNNENNLVFCSKYGTPIEQANFAKIFYRIVKKAGIPHTNLHSLRHTFATRGLENGIELKVMQELLGHSSITVTADIYSHVLQEKKREAINKLQNVFDAASK